MASLFLVVGTAGCRESGGDAATAEDLAAWEFPQSVGEFVRVSLTHDTEHGEQIAGYNLDTPSVQVALTVFVYPAPALASFSSPGGTVEAALTYLTEQHFEESKRALEAVLPAVLVSDGPHSIRQRGADQQGFLATYTLRAQSPDGVQDITSLLYVFRDGDWTVKYRVTYPAAMAPDAERAVGAFLEGLRWP